MMHSMDNNIPSPSSHLPSILKKGHSPVITTEHAPNQPLIVFIIQKCKYHWQINGFVDDKKVGSKSKQEQYHFESRLYKQLFAFKWKHNPDSYIWKYLSPYIHSKYF